MGAKLYLCMCGIRLHMCNYPFPQPLPLLPPLLVHGPQRLGTADLSNTQSTFTVRLGQPCITSVDFSIFDCCLLQLLQELFSVEKVGSLPPKRLASSIISPFFCLSISKVQEVGNLICLFLYLIRNLMYLEFSSEISAAEPQ